MKHCIYLKKTEPEVTFLSEEHIFPAGIGGIQKLPMEFVSHDCNNAFSKLELPFMRNSLIALPRQFYGPGKRGNLNPKNATKGQISIINGVTNDNDISLGYISLGKTYSISQVKIDINGTCQFISKGSSVDLSSLTSEFIGKLEKFNGNYTLFEDERIKESEFILGESDGKWYLALSNKDLESEISKYVQMLIVQKPFENVTPSFTKEQPRINQTLQFDENSYYRVCAKIIFNYLAFVKGQQFVLQDSFDPLRNWIVNGGENNFARLNEKEAILSNIQFPDQSHKLFISKHGKYLIGYISFYDNSFDTVVILCDGFKGNFDVEGFICDWKNRQEFKFIDYINTMQKND